MRILCRIVGVMLPLISHAAPQTWNLANDQISRTVTFTPAQGLYTERLFSGSESVEVLAVSSTT